MATKFRRHQGGIHPHTGHHYAAKSTRWTFYIEQEGRRSWHLRIFDGSRLAFSDRGHGAKRDCVAIVDHFVDLGDDYRSADHGYRNRETEAVLRAHADFKAQFNAQMGKQDKASTATGPGKAPAGRWRPARGARVRVDFTVDLPPEHGPVTEALRTAIAVCVSTAVHEQAPGAGVRWTSIGGRVPEVVATAELNGRTLDEQWQLDRDFGE